MDEEAHYWRPSYYVVGAYRDLRSYGRNNSPIVLALPVRPLPVCVTSSGRRRKGRFLEPTWGVPAPRGPWRAPYLVCSAIFESARRRWGIEKNRRKLSKKDFRLVRRTSDKNRGVGAEAIRPAARNNRSTVSVSRPTSRYLSSQTNPKSLANKHPTENDTGPRSWPAYSPSLTNLAFRGQFTPAWLRSVHLPEGTGVIGCGNPKQSADFTITDFHH